MAAHRAKGDKVSHLPYTLTLMRVRATILDVAKQQLFNIPNLCLHPYVNNPA
jgi:hypothetical protein